MLGVIGAMDEEVHLIKSVMTRKIESEHAHCRVEPYEENLNLWVFITGLRLKRIYLFMSSMRDDDLYPDFFDIDMLRFKFSQSST